MNWFGIVFLAVVAFVVGLFLYSIYRSVASGVRRGRGKQRDEALFVSMFPDLQPYFHPERLVEFVRAQRSGRRGSVTSSSGTTWKNPPGLGVHSLEIEPGNMRVPYRMRDASGALLGQFLYDAHAEGGVLRVGEGKLTVNVTDAVPRVRYWHPHREFKWSRTKGWAFIAPIADYDSYGSSGSSDSSSHSFSSSSDSHASSQGPTGGGGTFDGGGASGGWDAESSAGSSAGSSGESSAGSSAEPSSSTTSY